MSVEDTKNKLIESLKKVIDPEIHINIVDLGLIYRLDVNEEQSKLEIDFTLTTPGCPLADVIEEDINKACRSVLADAKIIATLVWSPMWNVDFMSEDAKLELGFPV